MPTNPGSPNFLYGVLLFFFFLFFFQRGRIPTILPVQTGIGKNKEIMKGQEGDLGRGICNPCTHIVLPPHDSAAATVEQFFFHFSSKTRFSSLCLDLKYA